MKRERLNAVMNAFVHMRNSADGKTASECTAAYPAWRDEMYAVGDIVRRGDLLYKRIQPMTYLEGIPPEDAPALWDRIMYREGIRIIPEVITATSAFALDELGWWGDVLYRSLIAANVYTPEQYPAGWEAVE